MERDAHNDKERQAAGDKLLSAERERLQKKGDLNDWQVDELMMHATSEKDPDMLDCFGKWTSNFVTQLVDCLVAGVNLPEKDDLQKCFEQVRRLRRACVNLPLIERLGDTLLSERCTEDRACGGVMNVLVTDGSPDAQKYITSFLKTPTGKEYTGPWLSAGLVSLTYPTLPLLRALLEVLREYVEKSGPKPVHSGHKPNVGLLLSAAALELLDTTVMPTNAHSVASNAPPSIAQSNRRASAGNGSPSSSES